MARLAFKPDNSFFRKIAIGAVGSRAVSHDLSQFGHNVVELERGSMDTKLWKEVKRKRVRIPDLLCINCGVRIECRAKTKSELSMSHSFTDEARAWDFGMVDDDWIAFPVCEAIDEEYWSIGKLGPDASYWHERNWVGWRARSWVNYFPVRSFRSVPHDGYSTKGVTEGSETSIVWKATFATNDSEIEHVQIQPTLGERSASQDVAPKNSVTMRRLRDDRRIRRSISSRQTIFVRPGDTVQGNQVIAGGVVPLHRRDLSCSGALTPDHISRLLASRERTLRFTGVKLARLRGDPQFQLPIQELRLDPDEDVYIRLEGAAYLASVCAEPTRELFAPFLESSDQQTQLEGVITLGETATLEAIELLSEILDSDTAPYFLRSAAA